MALLSTLFTGIGSALLPKIGQGIWNLGKNVLGKVGGAIGSLFGKGTSGNTGAPSFSTVPNNPSYPNLGNLAQMGINAGREAIGGLVQQGINAGADRIGNWLQDRIQTMPVSPSLRQGLGNLAQQGMNFGREAVGNLAQQGLNAGASMAGNLAQTGINRMGNFANDMYNRAANTWNNFGGRIGATGAGQAEVAAGGNGMSLPDGAYTLDQGPGVSPRVILDSNQQSRRKIMRPAY